MLGHICIINAPSMFKVMWSMVKSFVDPVTASKIEVLSSSSDATQALLRWVDADNLMVCFGGRSRGELSDDVGPWNDPQTLASIGFDLPTMRRYGSWQAPPLRLSSEWAPAAVDGQDEDESFFDARSDAGSRPPSVASSPRSSAAPLPLVVTSSVAPDTAPTADASTHDSARSQAGLDGAKAQQSLLLLQPSLSLATSAPCPVLPQTSNNSSTPLLGPTATATPGGKVLPLAERVKRLERMLAMQQGRLAQPLLGGAPGAAGRRPTRDPSACGTMSEGSESPPCSDTISSRSGTLMWRVEVLEDSMEVLLRAHEVALGSSAAVSQPPRPRSCCCAIM